MPSIRSARAADAGALAALAEATFRETFSADNPPAPMDAHCSDSYGESIQAAEIADPRICTLVAEEAHRLIGFAQLRWGAAPDCVEARMPGEIQRLYVVERWHGKGVAGDLMHACVAELQGRGCDAAWLGVWERNPKAIAFYAKHGFLAVGEHRFDLGGDLQRDIVMRRALRSD